MSGMAESRVDDRVPMIQIKYYGNMDVDINWGWDRVIVDRINQLDNECTHV